MSRVACEMFRLGANRSFDGSVWQGSRDEVAWSELLLTRRVFVCEEWSRVKVCMFAVGAR